METGQFKEEYRTRWAKAEPEKTRMEFQAHFIESQEDLHKLQQTYRQGEHTSAGVNNSVGIQDALSKLDQASAEDWSSAPNPTIANITLKEKLALYTNRLSAKEAGNEVLQMEVRNL